MRNEWVPFADHTIPRGQCSGCILGDYIYVCGGHLKGEMQFTMERVNYKKETSFSLVQIVMPKKQFITHLIMALPYQEEDSILIFNAKTPQKVEILQVQAC